jgi:hypothetical protein
VGSTRAEKVWDAHVVQRRTGEPDLLHIDLHLLHELNSPVDIPLTPRRSDAITAYERRRREALPTTRRTGRRGRAVGRATRAPGPPPDSRSAPPSLKESHL